MKKFLVVVAGFFLSTGISIANPNSADCGDDDVQPIVTSMVEK